MWRQTEAPLTTAAILPLPAVRVLAVRVSPQGDHEALGHESREDAFSE